VTFVAAAGNDASDLGTPAQGIFPANLPDALAVSAFDHLDQRASFSSYGAKIDVAAPGGGDADPTATLYSPQRSVLSLSMLCAAIRAWETALPQCSRDRNW